MADFPVLYNKLKKYAAGDFYPFHMPGHKRQVLGVRDFDFMDPYQMDITEIEGFDNLHHPEGVIRESMEWAASVYGSDRTYYLINGSSCGILSAISGVVPRGGTLLMSRNCHKAVYHGVFLNSLRTKYVYPQFMEKYGVQCGLSPEKIHRMLEEDKDISAVLVVSPTYDGIVSDIESIAKICHGKNIPLIVDEAHGAHFRYGDIFPTSALELGADVVIQSVHKTLPCFTQSAILHLREGYVDRERVERYLQIYQSSSPSYVLMAGIELGIWWMEQEEGRGRMKDYSDSLLELRRELKTMKHLKLMGREIAGLKDIFDMDVSKLIVSAKGTGISGVELCRRLREEYHLEMEMCTEDYVTAIATVMDTREGLWRLKDAFLDIDASLRGDKGQKPSWNPGPEKWEAKIVLPIHEAWDGKKELIPLRKGLGRISAGFIYVYPPGIPVIAPGERFTGEVVSTILRYKEEGLCVHGWESDPEGISPKSEYFVSVLKEEEDDDHGNIAGD